MAGGSFSIQKDNEMPHGEIKRGTKIMGYTKENHFGFLEDRRLKNLVKKHYEIVGLPTNEEYASFYKLMYGDWEANSVVKYFSVTNEGHCGFGGPSSEHLPGDFAAEQDFCARSSWQIKPRGLDGATQVA